MEKRQVECPKCGTPAMTRSCTSILCKGCKKLVWLGAKQFPENKKTGAAAPPPSIVGAQLGGYCADCGLMRMKYEHGGYPRCGGTKITRKAPPEASRIEAQGYTTGASSARGRMLV